MDALDIKDLGINIFMQTPLGLKLNQGLQDLEQLQELLQIAKERKDEDNLLYIKIGTTLTLAILTEVAQGKNLKELTKDDYARILSKVTTYGIVMDGQIYTQFIFWLYIRWFDSWIENLEGFVSEETLSKVGLITSKMQGLSLDLTNGIITEPEFVEESLWLCLEALIKLLAATGSIVAKSAEILLGINVDIDPVWLEKLPEAISSIVFEYARYVHYSKEQAIIIEYLNSEKELEIDLEARYQNYLKDLENQINEFNQLLEISFSSDFEKSFKASMKLAQLAGVSEDEVLDSIESIDDYFLD